MEQLNFRWGRNGERAAILSAADAFFSSSGQGGFAALLPRYYGSDADFSSQHFLALEGTRIVGLLAAFPFTLSVYGTMLSACAIGMVSTAPDQRGRGVMSALLCQAIEALRARGTVICTLGGQRRRYEHFGFEPCGTLAEYVFTPSSLGLTDADTADFLLRPFAGEDDVLHAHMLSQRRGIHVVRPAAQFGAICRTWGGVPLVLDKNGSFAGYAVTSRRGDLLYEAELADPDDLAAALYCCLRGRGLSELRYSLLPDEPREAAQLNRCCEYANIGVCHSFLPLAPLALLRACFQGAPAPRADGRFVLEVSGWGRFSFEIEGGRAEVRPTAAPAALSLDPLAAMQLLFAPLGAAGLAREISRQIPAGWLPLPLFLPRLDQC